MKNIVITGVAGFVGSTIADLLISNGYNIIGIDNFSSNVNFTPSKVEFHNMDLNGNIQNIMQKADCIIHAAAHADIRHNWDNKEQRDHLFSSNELATRSILEQMPDVPIIFLSTAGVYGSLSLSIVDRPLIESDATPESAESPYAASKLACESYVAAWSFKRKIPWYCLRLVNQVGARYHRGVITDFHKMIKEKGHIHASDNGQQKKNWVSVEDTANSILYILQHINIIPSGIYNLTSDERWSWRDIVSVVTERGSDYKKKFELSWEDKLIGTVGDPANLFVSGAKLDKYYKCNKSIKQAVIETLNFIGWTK
jgi:UDP-glucose 4-epimerase